MTTTTITNPPQRRNQIIQGDALTVLKTLPSESVDMTLCSPPYYNLRDYSVEGQIGLESTPQEYIDKLVAVFDQVKRVLKPSGSCWIVISDSYGPDKSLMLVPERFAISMIDHGWILRNVIIWEKKNCMPSSVKDRMTNSHEYVLFFTNSPKYYFETQYEPYETTEKTKLEYKKHRYTGQAIKDYDSAKAQNPSDTKRRIIESMNNNKFGRIKRSVWTINVKQFSGQHFAIFPEKLCEIPIKAGCPEFICCKCGTPRKTLYKEIRLNTRPGLDVCNKKSGTEQDPNASLHNSDLSKYRQQIIREPMETLTDCGCNDFYCYKCKKFINLSTLENSIALQGQEQASSISDSVGCIKISQTETTRKKVERDNKLYKQKLRELWQVILRKEDTVMLLKKMWSTKTGKGWSAPWLPESEGRESIGLEGRQKNDAGLCSNLSTKSSFCYEDGLGLCHGTSVGDGEVSRTLSQTKRKYSPQKWNQGRQQAGESRDSYVQQSLWKRFMPILSQEFHDKIVCPFCQSESIGVERYNFSPGIVLDPFFGSGTTGVVARKLGRDFIGIELNQDYCDMARKRLEHYLKQERLRVL